MRSGGRKILFDSAVKKAGLSCSNSPAPERGSPRKA